MYKSHVSFLALAVLFGALSGCSSDESKSDAPPQQQTAAPEPVSGAPLCILSADCPDGQHCDLGECVQSCNTEDPCTGEKTCSPRARCIEAEAVDTDPAPATKNKGSITVDRDVVFLRENDSEFTLKLASDSKSAVRYRVTIQAPFITIDEKRGEFEGEGTLSFKVDATKAKGREASGSLKIFTDLGERVVEVSLKKGVTGKYQGAFRYNTNGVPLGDARVAVELIENAGDVNALFDPDTSLLFPKTSYGTTTGFGTDSAEDGIQLTVLQRIDAGLGGDRNHFGRDLGRRITMTLEQNSLGDLEGTFQEKIYGLFDVAIELEGTVVLHNRPGEEDPDFELGEDTTMPSLVSPPLNFADIMGKNTYETCPEVLSATYGANWDDSEANRQAAFAAAASSYYSLDVAMAARAADGRTYAQIMADCDASLSEQKPAAKATKCAWLPALACALSESTGPGTAPSSPLHFNALMPLTVGPSLLIAQQHVVDALEASFAPGGLANERIAYDDAAAALDGTAKWILHPDILGFMRDMTPEDAKGADPAATDKSTEHETYPAGRSLARVLQVLATIDGERSRVAGIDVAASDSALVEQAQERAVLSLLEAAALIEITKNWGISPDVISADLSGLLSPMDSGFGALLDGARAFGVPDGFIPFVWRPEDAGKGATNFEQMLALAAETVNGEASLEEAYNTNARAFENGDTQLLTELQSMKLTYDSQIMDICGDDFAIDSVKTEADWGKCGTGDSGDAGVGMLDIALMDARIEASHGRLLGMQDKINIDQEALARTQGVRASTLNFVEQTGKQLAANTMATGILDAVQQSLSIASNSQVMNGGAPAALAAASVVIGIQKSMLAVERQQLETAQTMRFQKQDAEIELVNGMANIQKQIIDMNQLGIEMIQDGISKQEAVSRVNNSVDRAKRLFALRTQALAIAGQDPSHDPAFRLMRDSQAIQLLDSRARAQRMLYLAARALEYEVNTPLASLGSAVMNARSSLSMSQLESCLSQIHSSYRVAFGTPQQYTTEVSVREMLGITGPRTDECTGEELTAGQQFRLITQKSQKYDESGALTITFSTNLQPGNGLWSTDVCGDRISTIQAQLVGDNLGDNEAQVNLALTGAAIIRECDSDAVQTWSMSEGTSAGTSIAVVQAGVNSYGTAEPNSSLFGQSVARASWQITIPPGSIAPSNEDLDLSQLEDIVLKIQHKAAPRKSTPLVVDTACLMSIN